MRYGRFSHALREVLLGLLAVGVITGLLPMGAAALIKTLFAM